MKPQIIGSWDLSIVEFTKKKLPYYDLSKSLFAQLLGKPSLSKMFKFKTVSKLTYKTFTFGIFVEFATRSNYKTPSPSSHPPTSPPSPLLSTRSPLPSSLPTNDSLKTKNGAILSHQNFIFLCCIESSKIR